MPKWRGRSDRSRRWDIVLVVGLMLIWALVGGCASSGQDGVSASPAPSAAEEPVITVVGDNESKSLTMAELKAMPSYTGWAGIKTSVGTLIAPEKYTGVRLTDLGALVGGISKENGVTVLAKDGYGMTLSYAQAHGEEFTTFDPATGMEEPPSFPLNVIIAYARNGKPLDPEGEGPLRLEIAQDEAAQLVDGHWTVKWLDRVEVKKATSDWSVVLKGAVDAQLTRLSYRSCSSPGCHGSVWTEADGSLWQGVPLWLVVGLVDDAQRHDAGAFNRRLVKKGYEVEIRSSDDKTVVLSSKQIFARKEILLADKKSGSELPEEFFPMRLVGPGLAAKEMIGKIIKVVVRVPRLK